jgi:hypothetical protein
MESKSVCSQCSKCSQCSQCSQNSQYSQKLKKIVGNGSTIIQEGWQDYKDLVDLIKEVLPNYKVISNLDIRELNLADTDISVLFCDTDISLELLNKSDTKSMVEIKTYPECLKSFLKRKISVVKIRDLPKDDSSYFIGPLENDETFYGQIICSNNEKVSLIENIELKMGRNDFDTKRAVFDKTVYYCTETKKNVFNTQHRIFIADGEIFEIIDCTDYLIDEKDRVYQTPPSKFLNEIVSANEYKYCVIDVALRSDGEWCLVEVNHPLSPKSRDLSIDQYVYYCCKAWKYFIMKKNN